MTLARISTPLLAALPLLLLALLPGCSNPPRRISPPPSHAPATPHVRPAPAHPALTIALGQLNAPYRYGGLTPQGFDCSGLIHYSFARSGMEVPRTSVEQYRHAQRISLDRIRPGDLLFFRGSRRKPTHVGIYAGDRRFVHASTGEHAVVLSSMDNPYWRQRLLGAGRY